ncbi:MAG: 3-phosphoshikimate 1-carboxyvinyltransferase [Nitrososphaerota archaeon]
MDRLYVAPSIVTGKVNAPPSKSYTHRAFAISLIIDGESVITNPLVSGDTKATMRICKQLGAELAEENENSIIVKGGRLCLPDDILDAENSGTTLRLFTAISSLAPPGYVILTGDDSLRNRPMQPLLDALKMLGVECWSSRGNGCAPIIVRSGGMRGGEATIRGDISSQFISALLIASTRAEKYTEIRIVGQLVSRNYVDATIEVLKRYGFEIKREGYSVFMIDPGQSGRPTSFKVPGDFSSSSFILAGAYLTRSKVEVRNLDLSLPQADSAILDVLREFDVKIRIVEDTVSAESSGPSPRDKEFILRDSPDLLPVLAVMAAKTPSQTIIKGVKHARFKESDRISCVADELVKLGVQVEVFEDGMKIVGREELEGGVELDAHKDHRLFMAFTILSASTKKGCIVNGLRWAEISYPGFLKDLERLNVSFKEI